MTKKILSIILSVIFIIVLCFSFAFAESPKKFVVLGDSIAWGTGVYNSESACYGKIVADTNGYDYVNYGFDGCRSWDLLERMQDDTVKKDIAGADIINISIGGNDYLQQNLLVLIPQVLIGIDENMDNIENDFAEYFSQIIKNIKALNSDAVIIVNELYNPESGILGSIYGEATKRINRVIQAEFNENPYDFYFMELSDIMENHPENIALDTIHPSAVGNVAIAGRLLETLCYLGIEENAQPVINNTGIDELPFSSYIFKNFLDFFRSLISRFASLG